MDKMKQYMKSFLVTIALLWTTIGTWANGTVVIVKQVNGVEAAEASPGEVQSSVSGTTCTLTVTPASNYYLIGITAVRTIDSNNSQGRTRVPGIDEGSIAVTAATENPTDLSQPTSYTLTMPDSPYDVEVRANFGTRTTISAEHITLNPESVTYDGTAKETTVTVKVGENTLTLGTDYTVAFSNNVNVPVNANSPQPTVTVTGIGAYTGTATKTFAINKAAGTISYATASVSKTYGDEPFTNELTITGDGTVTYSTSNEKAATVDGTGKVTIVGNGEATITATVADKDGGNYTYETKTASYLLSIGTEAMEVSATAYTGTYDGQAHTISVTAPDGANVKYGTTEGSYNLDAAPTYTEAGTYTVFYQVTKPNFTTVSGSQTVTISQAAGSISFATATVNKTEGDAAFTQTATVTGDGTVSYASSNTAVATVNEKTGEVTIIGAGSATITATVVDGNNYTYGTKTATYTLNVSAKQEEEPEPQPEPVEPTLNWGGEEIEILEISLIFGGDYSGMPTLYNPANLTVEYSSSNKDVATVDENGAVDIVAAGTTIISAAFAGNDDYTKKTASYTLTVSKAKTELKFSAATAQATMNAEFEAPTLTKTPENLEGVEFTSSNTATATVDKNTGAVTLVGAGETTIKAAFAGSTVYEASEASYTLTVNRAAGEGYPLWVNGTQVTINNWQDVLGHTNNPEIPFYIFNAEKKQLLIDHDQTRTTVIESRMPELNIYLLDVSKIDHIFFNNTGDDSNKGTLTFTTNGNFPGKLVLTNSTEGESAITGFSEINYKWNLVALEPDGVDYNTTKLQMEYKEKDEDGKETGNILVADNITIGQAIVPITEKKTIHFEETQLVEKDEDGHEILDEDGNPIPANLSNYAYTPSNTEKNVVLITLNPENIGEGAGGVGVEDGFSGIYIGDTMTDTKAGQVADDVNNQNMVPGGSTYAENYDGFTFMLPAGYGIVEIDDFVEDGYEFHLIIGTDDPIALDDSNSRISQFDATSQHVQAEIHFNVKEPVYCYLYLVRKTSGARGVTPIGKRETAHGKVVSVSVKVKSAISTDPPSEATGGVIPESEDPVIEIDTDGIIPILYTDKDRMGNNNKWYNLNGQQIEEPTKPGLYFHNRKKIIIK